MHFLAGTWYIWLIIAVVLVIAALVMMINKMGKAWRSHNIDDSPFAGMIPIFITGLLASVSTILFVIGIIATFLKL